MSAAVAEFVAGFYRREPYAAKRAASDADASVRTAERWVTGRKAPETEAFVTMIRNNPELFAAFCEWTSKR